MSSSFRVVRELGRGGGGVVWLAETPAGKPVALKRPHTEDGDELNLKQTLEREVALCKSLEHPNIVQVYECGSDSAGLYLTMEWVDGTTVAKLHHRARQADALLPFEAVAHVARAMARALLAAHGFTAGRIRGIVHRDVSLDNLLVDASGEVKLSDFGIAYALGTTRATAQGSVKGKLSYLAPELLDGADPSPQTDVFAAGAVLFRLLTGSPPFRGRNDGELLRAIAAGAAAPLGQLAPAVPQGVAEWVDAALRRDPTQRPGLGALLDVLDTLGLAEARCKAALHLAVVQLGPVAPKAPVATSHEVTLEATRAAPAAPRRSRAPLAVAGVLAVALAGAAAWWWQGRAVPVAAPVAPIAAAPVAPIAVAPEPAHVEAAPVPAPELPVEAEPPKPEARTVPAARPKTATGSLWVRASPWGEVFIDGARAGQTPMSPLKLSTGKHSVIVSNPELKARRVYEVQVSPGKTTELRVKLGD